MNIYNIPTVTTEKDIETMLDKVMPKKITVEFESEYGGYTIIQKYSEN